MKLDKLIKVSKEHAEQMYKIVLDKHNRDIGKFLKKQGKKV